MKPTLKMKQILVAQWEGANGQLSYSTLALGEDGAVYRYDVACKGWIRYIMKPAKCGINGHTR